MAKHLGYVYVDTGAMYRAVTYYAMQNGLISDLDFNKEALIYQLPNIKISFKFNKTLGFAEVYLNAVLILKKKYAHWRCLSYVSKVAAISEIRQKLVEQQQQMGQRTKVLSWMVEILELWCFLMQNLSYL